jgi:multicomponent Na+:H+ antiporter subunit D
MFVFYEVLTLSTYPLVAHKGDERARRGARTYLIILLATSLAFLLPAIVTTFAVTGGLAFRVGGMFPAATGAVTTGFILVLFAFGIGKAALMPVHAWLPSAMVAPTPVSALLHAVAVVKAGVFAMLKVSIYVFGPERMQSLPAAHGLALLAGVTIVVASLIAMTKDDLKARLAYSTISQLSYVTLGAMLATPAALLGAALQILMHAFGKITLFMSAGAIYTGAKKTQISTMTGLGRYMPWTFGAFLVGAVSIIGLPPLGGAWAKLNLITGAADAGRPWLVAALAVSGVLNVAYLLPIVARGVFLPPSDGSAAPKGAPRLAVLAPVMTAAGCVVLFFFADAVAGFLAPVFTSGGRP